MVCTRQLSLNARSFSILESEDFGEGMVAEPMRDGDFWHVFATSRNAMLLMDDERRYTDLNEAAAQMLGVEPGELEGRLSDELVPEELHEDVGERWRAFLRKGHQHG